ncbi:hypothetical protein LTR91_013865 [Friedmanniomyces endolithicus]|uniref:Uncharacterized protein n=2 Tax=Friedmanniomyces endolithicus TaxID=329885 RepID=A0AAN6G0Y2_9PEZI|nr:hypothetical protein LTS09_017035 [Friedmanniomyces endolithicus]KAK0310761.1 hypothetical protein LTR01_003916 [Friedmanniomyces endolithicus]KAK0328074.1 hypothetical protein LTR82_000001 [Friedmanniomyces endolithicus]KAK0823693.1 hypothetical protein LTR73_008273 [Friedmanniomyces endolithicus]KAK0909600.1 hypothetical protein LTR57_016310 [Friedmanniomyces endolithicus]
MYSPRSEVVQPTNTRPKSPPLAFEPTPNDALAPLNSSSPGTHTSLESSPQSRTMSGTTSTRAHSAGKVDMQMIVDQQTTALQLLHEAFAAERQVWSMEREQMYQRIASLEQLLKMRDHYSPAKSPILSPANGAVSSTSFSSITSPQSRSTSNAQRLPSIAEDENTTPLGMRRGGAPRSIDLPGGQERPVRSQRGSLVSFDGSVMIDDVPVSPASTARNHSPPPPNNRNLAGHTPLKAPRAPSSLSNDTNLDDFEDTPTRHNTSINIFLTRNREGEEDVPLKGPLSLPELPNNPDNLNFTLEALSKRLEQVAKSPNDSRPMVFAQKSPGLASPAESAESQPDKSESPPAGFVQPGSGMLSPSANTVPPIEYNGVKLKKKASTNFGAPFGQLGGFGGRKMS